MTTETNHAADHAEQPPRRKPGPKPGQRNALRFGLRSSHLPKGASWITSQCGEFRKSLEDATLAEKGSISVVDASAIDLAMQSQRTLLLLQRRYRLTGDKMSDADTLSSLDKTRQAAVDRHNAILSLGLSSMPTAPASRKRRKGAPAAPSLAASMYAENGSNGGVAQQTSIEAAPVSATSGVINETPGPIETPEKFKEPPSLQDEG